MKKFMEVAMVLTAVLIPVLAFGLEPVEGVLEITGSMGTSGMNPYTPTVDILSATAAASSGYYGSYGYSQPSDSIFTNTSMDAYLALYILNTEPLYMIAPYFRFAAVFTNKEVSTRAYDQFRPVTVYQDRKDSFDMSYTGAGIRRYFIDSYSLPVNFYFGADIGYFSTLFTGPHSQIINYTDPGNKESSLVEKNKINRYSGGFFGMHLEAGADCWINKNLGLTFKAGIRNGSGGIKGVLNSTDKYGYATSENGKIKTQQINLFGGYLSTGIILSFGHKTSPKAPAVIETAPELLPEANAALEKGDAQYKLTNYRAALKMYDRALFYMQNAALYTKIANCLYYLGEKKDALRLYEISLKMNPENMALRIWLEGQR